MNNLKKLQLIILLNYTALGCIIGFVQGGIATILRQQGTPLSSMAWVFLLYLPFGLAFLWSPFLDRIQKQHPYRQQLFIAQISASILLIIMALISAYALYLPLLWVLALLLNVTVASLDLALDGLSCLICPAKSRPAVSGAKVAGLSLGGLIGGGVLVGQFAILNWTGVFIIISGILLVAMPFVRLVTQPKKHNHHHQGMGLRVAWQDPSFRGKLWRIALFTCCLMAVFNLNRLLLVDMGVSLQEIGMYLGTITPLGAFIVALSFPVITRHISYRNILPIVGAIIFLSVMLLVVCIQQQQTDVALAVSIIIGIACSTCLLVVGCIILDWANSGQSATDYALLYGLGRLFGIVLLVVLPTAIEHLGWTNYYLMMLSLLMMALFVLYRYLKAETHNKELKK